MSTLPQSGHSSPRVSVICPAWNGERFINQTIEALKAQDESRFEAIVVDDASSDSTPFLLSKINDPRFRVVTNLVNKRVIEARNMAIRAASAPYIAVTDQDDPSHPGRLRLQAEFLDQHPAASAVCSLIRSIDTEGMPRPGVSDWSFSGQEAKAAFVFHNFVSHSTLMFRRACIADPVYSPEHPFCEDYRLLVKLADHGDGVHVIRQRLVDYRYHDSNHTRAVRSDMAAASREIRLELLERLRVRPSDSEWLIHHGFEGAPAEISEAVHRDSGHWLEYLIQANRRVEYVDPIAFERVCAYKWLELSHKFTPLGKACWKGFVGGPVSALRHMPSQWISLANLRRKTLA